MVIVGLVLFVLLGAALTVLWRWVFDAARTSGASHRSRGADGPRDDGA